MAEHGAVGVRARDMTTRSGSAASSQVDANGDGIQVKGLAGGAECRSEGAAVS
jgi:hypothetical protein